MKLLQVASDFSGIDCVAQRSGMSAGTDNGARLNQFKNKGKDANVSSEPSSERQRVNSVFQMR